jgi:hypothetical protein
MDMDARRAQLRKMTRGQLAALCQAGIITPDGRRVVIEGGVTPPSQWSKDDLVASVMQAEFPPSP